VINLPITNALMVCDRVRFVHRERIGTRAADCSTAYRGDLLLFGLTVPAFGCRRRFRLAQSDIGVDHLVGERQQCWQNVDAECLVFTILSVAAAIRRREMARQSPVSRQPQTHL
jgi:hypothetical protein